MRVSYVTIDLINNDEPYIPWTMLSPAAGSNDEYALELTCRGPIAGGQATNHPLNYTTV
jgi:hypothetical protein